MKSIFYKFFYKKQLFRTLQVPKITTKIKKNGLPVRDYIIPQLKREKRTIS